MKLRSLALFLFASFAFALPATSVDLSGDPESIEAEKQRWVGQLEAKYEELANAKARHATAQAAYTRMRTRNKARGDARARVHAELQASEKALADAEAELEEALDLARREGVPPGWLRDAQSGDPAAPGS